MPLLVFEFLGTTEMLVIALVALIIFGPRKLPELGRSLGKSIGEFKRASEDFKRTWEREVEVERIEHDLRIDREVKPALSASSAPLHTADEMPSAAAAASPDAAEQSIARNSSSAAAVDAADEDEAATAGASGKQDWL